MGDFFGDIPCIEAAIALALVPEPDPEGVQDLLRRAERKWESGKK